MNDDPLCILSKLGVKFLTATTGTQRKRIFTEALNLIARHQVSPPPWLAAAILERFPVKCRLGMGGVTPKRAYKILLVVEQLQRDGKAKAADLFDKNEKMPLDKIAKKLDRPPTKLDAQIALGKEYRKKLTDRQPYRRVPDDTPATTIPTGRVKPRKV
jgi:hypothetical protein